MRKKEKEETSIMVWHSQQVEMGYLKEDAMYTKIGGTKVTRAHSETTEIPRMDKIRKIHQLQIILQMQITSQIQQAILWEIIPTTMYLPEDQDFKENVITVELRHIGEKIACF